MGKGPFNRYGMAVAAVTSAVAGAGIYYYGQTDVTPPVVAVTAPAAGTTVSGTSNTVTATATDNVGVVGVQFKLDGVNLGSEDTSSPYSISWDSTGVGDGTHNLSAVARDAAGNSATAAAVNVTVNNSGGGGGGGFSMANLWVNSSTGNDATCARQGSVVTDPATNADCATIAKAWTLARAGDLIGVQHGTYTGGTVTASLASYATAFPVGGTVTFTSQILTTGTAPSHIKFDATAGSGTFVYTKGIAIGCTSCQTIASNQPSFIFYNGGHTLNFSFNSIAHLFVENMEVGPDCCSDDGIHSGWGTGKTDNSDRFPQNVDLNFVGNYIHGMTHNCTYYEGQTADGVGPAICPGTSTVHVDCFQFDTGNGGNIIGNRCYDNSEQALFFGGVAAGFPPGTSCPGIAVAYGCYEGTWLIENNALGSPRAAGNSPFILGRGNPGTPGDCTTLNGNAQNPQFGPGATLNIYYNTTPGLINLIRSCSLPHTVNFVGNLAGNSNLNPTDCTHVAAPGGTVTWSHDIVSIACSGSDVTLTAAGGFPALVADTSAATPNFHLTLGTAAINGGDPGLFPLTDFDGQTRPLGGAPDVGADEAG